MASIPNATCGTRGALELLVVQATPFCNLDCAYCYLPNRSSTARMTEATLGRLFESVFSSPFVSDRLTVLWHAGEPLVAGIDYYRTVFDLIDRLNCANVRITHSVQTNGTLLDQHWIDFFRRHDVRIGVSLDGPPHLHDRYRRTRRGGGTCESVLRAVRLLRHNDYPFHVITVLTRESLSAADALFRFYIENGISDVAFNIEEIEGEHSRSSLQGVGLDEAVRSFFRDLLALVESHPGKLAVREFSSVFGAIADPRAAEYGNPQTEPMRIVTVGVNGELSTFSPELIESASARYKNFLFGNVHEGGLAGITTRPNFADVCADIRLGVEKCRQSCEYFELCLGGTPANKFFENGGFDTTETLYCRLGKKALIDVALERLERAPRLKLSYGCAAAPPTESENCMT
jgi:uncharacterized protein